MKISELNTQSFLGGTNVPANSYVLINYAESGSAEPVTKKVSVQELGKAIANDQQLYKKTVNGAVTTSVNNNAYVDGTAEKMVTASEKTVVSNLTSLATYPIARYDANTGLILAGGVTVPNVIQKNGNDIGYYATNSSDSWADLELSGGIEYDSTRNLLLENNAIVPNVLMYNSNAEVTGYYATSNSQSWTAYHDAPEVKVVDAMDYNYLFYDTCSMSAYYVQSDVAHELGQPLFWDDETAVVSAGHGEGATTLGAPVFWDDTDEVLKLYDGTEISAGGGGTPYAMNISNIDYYYVLNKDGDFYMTDSQGEDSVKLGTPIFYSENESGFGYYASGSFHFVDGITLRSSGE